MTAPEPTPAQLLATPVQFLKGVGPARAELLERLGLHTVRDVLFFFPRDYQDLSDQRDVDQLEEGKLQIGPRRGRRHRPAHHQRRRLHPRRLGPLPRRAPAGHLVQPALHARAVRASASG